MKKVLVTGGAGYIGSHAILALRDRGYHPIVFDNLSQGNADLIIPHLRQGKKDLYVADLLVPKKLESLFKKHRFSAVMHFAAKALVGESMHKPLEYYRNNVEGSFQLLRCMDQYGVRNLIFSSSAAVYGEPKTVPIDEKAPLNPVNPYGLSKKITEEILADEAKHQDLNYVSLRYFNVAGSDPAGRLGERRRNETHLIPRILQAVLKAQKKRQEAEVSVWGKDYPTRDGTCVRDYIHVTDLIEAHVLALDKMLTEKKYTKIYNLGTAAGYSVLEIIEACRQVTGAPIVAKFLERRPGDPATLVASAQRIINDLGWQPKFDEIRKIIETAWRWTQQGVGKGPVRKVSKK